MDFQIWITTESERWTRGSPQCRSPSGSLRAILQPDRFRWRIPICPPAGLSPCRLRSDWPVRSTSSQTACLSI